MSIYNIIVHSIIMSGFASYEQNVNNLCTGVMNLILVNDNSVEL